MLNRPVRYDPIEKAVIDAKNVVILHPFQKLGLPDALFHPLGCEIADCINAYIPESTGEALGLVPTDSGIHASRSESTVQNKESERAAEVVKHPKKKPGRPKGKR